MTNEEFRLEVDASTNRSKKLLEKKGTEYTPEGKNRLSQFYRAGEAQDIPPTQALVGFMTKHFTAIADMAKNPYDYSLKQFDEKITDLRNYTFLLDALIRDMEIE